MKKKKAESFLPLTHTTFYILLALIEPLHGYGIMQKVEEMSHGDVKIGPGTLYGALSKLEKQSIIEKYEDLQNDRKKNYQLTELGREVVQREYHRLEALVTVSRDYVKKLGGI